MQHVLGHTVPARILVHILESKFKRSTVEEVAQQQLSAPVVENLLRQIVQQKYEQRVPTKDVQDEFIRLLSGEQESLMEISYTKQQQKQKQKQQNKNQDSDTMDIFNKKHQLEVNIETEDYFRYTLTPETDTPKIALGLPIPVPILSLTYALTHGGERCVHVYPTLQFLYSHHIQAEYITDEVRSALAQAADPAVVCNNFLAAAEARQQAGASAAGGRLDVGQLVVLQGLSQAQYNGQRGRIVCAGEGGRWGVLLDSAGGADKPTSFKPENLALAGTGGGQCAASSGGVRGVPEVEDAIQQLRITLRMNYIRQNPQYTLAAISEGIYVIGMKDQFNVFDLQMHPLRERVGFISDEMGFVLFDRSSQAADKSVDDFGPYFIEQYILMEVLSKQEVAQNVLDYYVHHKRQLEESVATYSEAQGKGFVCWRFLMNEAVKAAKAAAEESRAGAPEPMEET